MTKAFSLTTLGIVGILLASLALAPFMAFAKGGDHGNGFGFGFAFGQKVRSAGSTLEIVINDNGKALVRGAEVTGISGSVITAKTVLGGATLSWTVNTSANTKFVNKGDKNGALSAIAVGDILSFNGTLNQSASTLTVDATTVKNWSKTTTPSPVVQDIFQGTLKSIASTTLPTTLVLTIKNVDHTVNVASNTLILGANWGALSLGSFVIGDTVRVFGTKDANTNTLNAIVVRNATR